MPIPAILAFCTVPLVLHLALVETRSVHLVLAPRMGPLFKLCLVTTAALAHWSIYASLLLAFGLTLRPRHEALITTMTRRLHGDIPKELAVYTRRVTIAWCCFFGLQLSVSIGLFCFAPLLVWSFFVNILDIPLIVVMFAAEYMVRLRVLRDPPRHSFAVIVKMIVDSRPAPGTHSAQGRADELRSNG